MRSSLRNNIEKWWYQECIFGRYFRSLQMTVRMYSKLEFHLCHRRIGWVHFAPHSGKSIFRWNVFRTKCELHSLWEFFAQKIFDQNLKQNSKLGTPTICSELNLLEFTRTQKSIFKQKNQSAFQIPTYHHHQPFVFIACYILLSECGGWYVHSTLPSLIAKLSSNRKVKQKLRRCNYIVFVYGKLYTRLASPGIARHLIEIVHPLHK